MIFPRYFEREMNFHHVDFGFIKFLRGIDVENQNK